MQVVIPALVHCVADYITILTICLQRLLRIEGAQFINGVPLFEKNNHCYISQCVQYTCASIVVVFFTVYQTWLQLIKDLGTHWRRSKIRRWSWWGGAGRTNDGDDNNNKWWLWWQLFWSTLGCFWSISPQMVNLYIKSSFIMSYLLF